MIAVRECVWRQVHLDKIHLQVTASVAQVSWRIVQSLKPLVFVRNMLHEGFGFLLMRGRTTSPCGATIRTYPKLFLPTAAAMPCQPTLTLASRDLHVQLPWTSLRYCMHLIGFKGIYKGSFQGIHKDTAFGCVELLHKHDSTRCSSKAFKCAVELLPLQALPHIICQISESLNPKSQPTHNLQHHKRNILNPNPESQTSLNASSTL